MRGDLIRPKEGETEFTVLNHYDESKRVSTRTHRYFYGPIEDTPFTLAIVLPEKYGSHELVSQQEIRHSRNNGKLRYTRPDFSLFILFFYLPVTEFFKGDNWRVHPDWVYCEYNSVSDLEKERESSGEYTSRDQEPSFGSPEEQVLHFLARAGRPGWKWMSVRTLSQHKINRCCLINLFSALSRIGTTQVATAASQFAQFLTKRHTFWRTASECAGFSQGWAVLLRSNPTSESGSRRDGYWWSGPQHNWKFEWQGGQTVSLIFLCLSIFDIYLCSSKAYINHMSTDQLVIFIRL